MEVSLEHAQHGAMRPSVFGSIAWLSWGLVLAPGSFAQVRVCVTSGNLASAFVLNRAEEIASRMFATAGVGVEWHSAASALCQGLRRAATVGVEFQTNRPAGEHPGAWAYALLYGGVRIVLLYDRIESSAGGPNQLSSFLAHVMAHEITHVLQGVSHHSETGVMRANWDARDLGRMTRPLPFAPEDIELIQQGLLRRALGAGSPFSPPGNSDRDLSFTGTRGQHESLGADTGRRGGGALIDGQRTVR